MGRIGMVGIKVIALSGMIMVTSIPVSTARLHGVMVIGLGIVQKRMKRMMLVQIMMIVLLLSQTMVQHHHLLKLLGHLQIMIGLLGQVGQQYFLAVIQRTVPSSFAGFQIPLMEK